ncbi:putative Ragulator complex protein LAMTOR3-B [Hypsibius exemplaris]|uniref:Ragulator complex protein LAMTOR3-B n=1 Tax=Hypsibius exemplaris TaxID=2072580 RepID=A0A1W0WFN8_HYPEX|nr:putative Ragulator complex protein LAMTOR3-B [Hypsibius exemplaris]
MAEELKRSIQEIMKTTPGVRGIVIADRDGVPIIRVNDETVPETVMRPGFLSSVGFATEQSSKLGYGVTNHIISIHERHQIVHFNIPPLILSVIADTECNTGILLTLRNELSDITDAVRTAIQVA